MQVKTLANLFNFTFSPSPFIPPYPFPPPPCNHHTAVMSMWSLSLYKLIFQLTNWHINKHWNMYLRRTLSDCSPRGNWNSGVLRAFTKSEPREEGSQACFPAGEPRLGSVGRPVQISRKPHFVNSQKCRQRWLWGTKVALLLHFISVFFLISGWLMLNIYLKNNSLWTIETYSLVWSGKGNCKKWTFIVVKKSSPQVHLLNSPVMWSVFFKGTRSQARSLGQMCG